MLFQRTVVGLLILIIAGLAGTFFIEWKLSAQLRTVKAFVEGQVFAEAVASCEKAQSSTPFKWNGGTNTSIVGLNSVKLEKYTVIASYTLLADGVYCDYDPVKKKADIGSNFLERDQRSRIHSARIFGPDVPDLRVRLGDDRLDLCQQSLLRFIFDRAAASSEPRSIRG